MLYRKIYVDVLLQMNEARIFFFLLKGPPCGRPHLAQQVTVEDLEDLIEAKLAESLHGVANEGGRPALGQPSHAVLPHSHLEAISDGLVLIRAHLQGAPQRLYKNPVCLQGCFGVQAASRKTSSTSPSRIS